MKMSRALSLSSMLFAQEAAKPITITLEALGDSEQGVASRITFRFAQPPEVPPETGLFLQGSLLQGGQVLRNFRFPVMPNSNAARRKRVSRCGRATSIKE